MTSVITQQEPPQVASDLGSGHRLPAGAVKEDGASKTPHATVFICHTMRCGSTLLCDALSNTGVAGHAEEYFPERGSDGRTHVLAGAALKDPEIWQLDWVRTPFEQCLDQVIRTGTTPNGVFSAKLRWLNMPYLGELFGLVPEGDGLSLAERLETQFPSPRYVWVTRRDKVRQAVSLVRARQSGRWKAMSPQARGSDRTEYNFHLVDAALRRVVNEECAWAHYFAAAGISPFTVVYEDLAGNYEATVRELLDHLGIGLPGDYAVSAPRLHKQADAASDDWVQRYRQDAQAKQSRRSAANLPALLIHRQLRETYVLPRLRTHLEDVRRRLTRLV